MSEDLLREILQELKGVKTELVSLNQRVGKLEEGQARLEEAQARLEGNQQKLEVKIEHEVIDKIRALFDDREMQNHRFDRIEVKLENVIVDLGYLVTKVARMERIAK